MAIGIAVIALLLLFPIRVFEIGNPDWRPLSWLHALCVVAVTFVFLWSIGGKPWLRHFAFPVLFTLVAVPWITPIEGPVIQGLMRIIAAFAAETANLLGIPAQVQGNLIRVRTGLIGVNEACSGVRSLQTSLMIGLLFGELKRLSILRRVVLIAAAIAIALVANLARAVFLVSIGAEEGTSAIDKWHDLAGYGIVALVFLGTLALAMSLGKRREGQKSEVRGQKSDEGRQSRISAAAIIWIAISEVAAAGWYHAHERNDVAMPRWRVEWPKDAPGFHEPRIDEGVRSTLRYDEAKEASWNLKILRTTEGQSSMVRCLSFFLRWNPGGSSVVRARAHRPDICLPAAGWRQVSDRGVKNYSINGDLSLPFHHLVFADDRDRVTAHTFFCLQEDELKPNEPRPDLVTSGPAQPDWGLIGRSRVVMNGVRNRGQQIIEVALISHEPLDDARAETEFGQVVSKIVSLETR